MADEALQFVFTYLLHPVRLVAGVPSQSLASGLCGGGGDTNCTPSHVHSLSTLQTESLALLAGTSTSI